MWLALFVHDAAQEGTRRKDASNWNNDEGELDPEVAKDILDIRKVQESGYKTWSVLPYRDPVAKYWNVPK